MMRRLILTGLLLGSVGLCLDGCSPGPSQGASEEEHAELAPFMGQLQRFSQKLGYAIKARNPELAAFYLHELHEIAEDIEKEVPLHDGYQIAALCKAMLAPAIERCEKRMSKGSWEERWSSYTDVITSCNSCHLATAHAFIRILPADGRPPFNQDFGVTPNAGPKSPAPSPKPGK